MPLVNRDSFRVNLRALPILDAYGARCWPWPAMTSIGSDRCSPRPSPLAFGHVAITGHGTVDVDRWPDPQVAIARVGQDTALRGDPRCLPPDAFAGVAAFIEAPSTWEPRLRQTDPSVATWDRLVAQLPEIPKTLDQELAVVKPELIARLAEKYFPNEDGNLDQHIIGQALAHLVRSGEVITTSE